jgi:hypothetical protein
MDLLIYTGAKDRSQSAATSASDVTALEGPDDFPQLVLGTTEPLTAKFLSAASTYESWSDDSTYTVTASLGYLTSTGLDVFAEATLSTVISDGKSGDLALDTTALAEALRQAIDGHPRRTAVQMTLQITVTDADGDRRIYAQLPVQVNGRVSNFTPRVTALPSETYSTTAEISAAYQARSRVAVEAIKWLVTNRHYDAVVVVSTTVTAALNSISDNGPSKRYLVYVPDGDYSDTITCKAYVDIVGESRSGVVITNSTDASTISNADSGDRAGNFMLANFTVVNSGATGVRYALHLDAKSQDTTRPYSGSEPSPVDIILYNVTARGGNNAAAGIGLWGGQRLYVIDSSFNGTSGNGVYIHNGTTAQAVPMEAYFLDVTATGAVDGIGYWGFDSGRQDFVVIVGGSYSGVSRDIDFQTSLESGGDRAIIYVSPYTTGTVYVDDGTRITSPPPIALPALDDPRRPTLLGAIHATGNITTTANVVSDKVIAGDDIETTSGSTSYSVATSKAVVGTGGGAARFTWIRSTHAAHKRWFDMIAAGDAVTIRVIQDDGGAACSIVSFLGDGSDSASGVMLLPGTTEATTGGAGSLTTSGGIYAAKKIISASSISPSGSSVTWTAGAGTPEGAVTAVVGSLYSRTNGGANTSLYVKESGSGNTGWVAK